MIIFYALPPVVSLLSFILPPRQQAVRLPAYLRVKNSSIYVRVYFVDWSVVTCDSNYRRDKNLAASCLLTVYICL
jgi:hypothetical protein